MCHSSGSCHIPINKPKFTPATARQTAKHTPAAPRRSTTNLHIALAATATVHTVRVCRTSAHILRCSLVCPRHEKQASHFTGSVGTVTRLPGRPGLRIPGTAKDLSLLQRAQTGCGAHPPSYRKVLEVLSSGIERPGWEADHLLAVPKLRMSGAIPPPPCMPSWRQQAHLGPFAAHQASHHAGGVTSSSNGRH